MYTYMDLLVLADHTHVCLLVLADHTHEHPCTHTRTSSFWCLQIIPGGGNAGPQERLLQWQQAKLRERAREARLAKAMDARRRWQEMASAARGAGRRVQDLPGQGLAAMLLAAARQVRGHRCTRVCAHIWVCACVLKCVRMRLCGTL